MGPMTEMTDAEKTAFAAMSDTEKKAYMEKKHTDMKVKRDAREAVIDKLLAGTALTADEETLRQTIITERTERKAQKEKMDAIRTKIQAGAALNPDEQATLDSMPKMGKK